MRQQTARLSIAGGALRPAAAIAVAAALLLQLLVTPPLALQMLSELGQSAWTPVLCKSGEAARADAPAHEPLPPASPHHHNGCLLCWGYSATFGLIAVAVTALAAAGTWRDAEWTWRAIASPPRRIVTYRSRAPPLSG